MKFSVCVRERERERERERGESISFAYCSRNVMVVWCYSQIKTKISDYISTKISIIRLFFLNSYTRSKKKSVIFYFVLCLMATAGSHQLDAYSWFINQWNLLFHFVEITWHTRRIAHLVKFLFYGFVSLLFELKRLNDLGSNVIQWTSDCEDLWFLFCLICIS